MFNFLNKTSCNFYFSSKNVNSILITQHIVFPLNFSPEIVDNV